MNTSKLTKGCIDWIKNWFEKYSGNAQGAIIGISGGKDSAIVAKLCCEALGKDKVFGVIIPNGDMPDYDDAILVCDTLGINYKVVDIEPIYLSFLSQIGSTSFQIPSEVRVNILPRVRMTVLYAMGQELHYRVAGTGNFSERFVGYCTKFGDTACDFNPIGWLNTDEVISIGLELGLPEEIVCKPPSDGLWGKTDEEQLGVTYKDINSYIDGYFEDMPTEVSDKICMLHKLSNHKTELPPMYSPDVSHL